MQEFMDTGVIPGAVDKRDPDRETYDRLVKKGKKLWSKADKSEMARIADRANNAYMQPKEREATTHTDSDVRIKTHQGKHKKSSVYTSAMGIELSNNGERNSQHTHTYTEGRTKQIGDGGEHYEDKVVAAEESFQYEFNGEGGMDTQISATARNWNGEHRDEFGNAGKRYPKFDSWRGSQTGNAGVYFDGKKGTSVSSIRLTDKEIKTFEGKAKNLDLTSLTQEDQAAVQRESDLRAKANKPLTDDQLADHLASKQAKSALNASALKRLGVEKGSPEYTQMLEEKKKDLLTKGTDAYLEGKTQDDMTQAAQEIKNPLHDALRRGKASDLQHALSQIKSGGDFSKAPYEVKRALLDRVASGKAGTEDVKDVQHDNRTWQAALAMMMGSDYGDKGKTDRGRIFHNMARSKIDGNNNRDNSSSPANEMMEIIGQVIPDIADLPQTGPKKDKDALRAWINGQIQM